MVRGKGKPKLKKNTFLNACPCPTNTSWYSLGLNQALE
jgi:hypothetical protein